MGSNMQRQAVPLMIKENPILSTGIENVIIHNNEYNTVSVSCGIVKYSSNKKIIIHESIKTKEKLDCNNKMSKCFLVKQKNKLKVINYVKYTKRTYKLKNKRSTSQNTSLYEESLIKKDQWIRKGQIITDGSSSYQGRLSLGKNILIAYMPWKGYNFEDAIVISERLVKSNIFTSIHIKKYKTFLINNETGEVC